jgi:hypothetical protein
MKAQTQEDRCSLAAEVLRSWGTLQLRATGSSMLPTLWPGDVLTIRSRSFQHVEPGEIALYVRGGRFFVHRVARESNQNGEPVLVTQGDSMAQEDLPVRSMELLGTVRKIHRDGAVMVPAKTLSPFRLTVAWMLCHWSLCRRVVLRLHARGSGSSSRFDLAVAKTS